jgi:TPR repeat protein
MRIYLATVLVLMSIIAAIPAIAASDRDAAHAKADQAYSDGDYAAALKIWRPLAEQGDARAQYNLGVMYSASEGVLQDYAAAVTWFRKAAEQEHAWAQTMLGAMYDKGQGVPQDYAAAVTWYRKAAEQGEVVAQNNLGWMYRNGQGVPQDDIAAHMWFNIAAANGKHTTTENRDFVAKGLSSADIMEAQKRAKRCFESGYKDCD